MKRWSETVSKAAARWVLATPTHKDTGREYRIHGEVRIVYLHLFKHHSSGFVLTSFIVDERTLMEGGAPRQQ
jgi:hypothetical protein